MALPDDGQTAHLPCRSDPGRPAFGRHPHLNQPVFPVRCTASLVAGSPPIIPPAYRQCSPRGVRRPLRSPASFSDLIQDVGTWSHGKGRSFGVLYTFRISCHPQPSTVSSQTRTTHHRFSNWERMAFHEAVEDCIETCARIGKEPQKACSGQVMFKVSPEAPQGCNGC